MVRRKTLLSLLVLLALVCEFVPSGARAGMVGYESKGQPQVHMRQILPLPGPGTAFGGVDKIWPFSSTNVWVQGSNLAPSMYEQFQQVTQHFDGQKWTSYLPTVIQYNEIVSSSTTNTWAVGSQEVGPHGYATEMVYLDHFDGHGWKNIASGDTRYFGVGPMTVSGNDFWYVTYSQNQGYHISIHHYSPLKGWSEITNAGLPTTGEVEELAVISPINMWATFGFQRVFHYDGLSWHEAAIQPLMYPLLSLSSASPSKEVWIGGTSPTGAAIVERWNGKAWQVVPLAPYPSPDLNRNHVTDRVRGIFAISSADVWVLIDPAYALKSSFEHWDGRKWTLYATPQYLSQYYPAPLRQEQALGVVTGNSTSQSLVALTP